MNMPSKEEIANDYTFKVYSASSLWEHRTDLNECFLAGHSSRDEELVVFKEKLATANRACAAMVEWSLASDKEESVAARRKVTDALTEWSKSLSSTDIPKEVEAKERVIETARDWRDDTADECDHDPAWQELSRALIALDALQKSRGEK